MPTANSSLDEWDLALADFDRALELDQENKEVKKEIVVVKRKVAVQDQKDRKLYKNMFSKMQEDTP